MDFEQNLAALYDRLVRQAKFYYPNSIDNAFDLCNDTVEKMIRYKDKFEEGTSLIAWGSTIMRNIFINDYRRSSKLGFTVETEEEGADIFGRLELYAPDTDDYSKVLDIREAIDALPEGERIAINYLLCGYSYERMAEIFEVPIGTVKSRLHIARKKLKKVLTR